MEKKIFAFIIHSQDQTLPRWLSGRAFASHAGDQGSIPGSETLKSLKREWQLHGERSAKSVKVEGPRI